MFGQFYTMLADVLVAPKRTPALAVCCIDIDNFSALNSDFGMAMGDQVLHELEARLGRFLGPSDFMARSAGDQFYLCLDVSDKKPIFRQLKEQIEIPFRLGEHICSLTASIGIALVTSQQKSPDRAIRNALHACITVKNNGGGRYEIFDDEGLLIQHNKSALLREITAALSDNQFQLFLQPKVNLADGRLAGFEALIRWYHPERGIISPLNFLPVIAHTDTEILVGHFVLDQGIELLKLLRTLDCNVSLSLNISPRQITDALFRRQIEQYATQYPQLIRQLCLEILESDSFDNLQLIQDYLRAYQACGISLSLDDFGTGFASLNNLMKLPLNEVKIDRNFIQDINTNSVHQIVVRHIVELSAALELSTVAEGIETAAEYMTVKKLGVQLAQGYYFERPFPSSELSTWLAEHSSSLIR
ncbi:putative bifunctional diguanylate cyclase/phosphodiesterase [Pseudidiomarina mangrovi]|uniref:putative bifunctional diguanylate cyclase/phosphodiesterase n=1 Tax=Pseudidiomarina mangrovi TaxID=2487133 RepID=UPI000FCB804E|nr:bifunctional diguanylate cyclase/phosphodiesterase [Pseudidiomarina mangrovi]